MYHGSSGHGIEPGFNTAMLQCANTEHGVNTQCSILNAAINMVILKYCDISYEILQWCVNEILQYGNTCIAQGQYCNVLLHYGNTLSI